ncbi:olfactory receptor 2AJ1-like [Macrotis lagotis]|uniref:olfactory receptor 2AJ1-like n=1 Tax=Macrotis lagotis TaxID=92651 RepID=UPI003D6906B9
MDLVMEFDLSVLPFFSMMAINYISGRKSITFVGCGFQIFLFVMSVGAECLILTAMSYDRYVAICHPLRYPTLMNHQISVMLAAVCWLGGIMDSSIHTIYVMLLPFCGTRTIDHFFCEIPGMLRISYIDTSPYEENVYMSSVFFLIPFSIILISYGQILCIMFHMKSMEAQKKAFSTCSSHLAVVAMYYGSCIFTCMRPKSYHTPSQDKVLAILFTILSPMLNPVIHSLRNKNVLCALTMVFSKALSHRNENF